MINVYFFKLYTLTLPTILLSMIPSLAISLSRSLAYRTEQPATSATSAGCTLADSSALLIEDMISSVGYTVANLELSSVLFLMYESMTDGVFKLNAIRNA